MIFKAASALVGLSVFALAACAPVTVPAEPEIRDASGPVQCKAEDWQSYVGKARTTLPQAPQGLVFRQACSTCAVTMDYRSDRVTFTYDDKGIISRVSCG